MTQENTPVSLSSQNHAQASELVRGRTVVVVDTATGRKVVLVVDDEGAAEVEDKFTFWSHLKLAPTR